MNKIIRSAALLSAFAGALVGALYGCSGKEAPKKAGPPAKGVNIILITVDTLRADHLSPYGYKGIKTPFVESLATRGALFEDAYSEVPITGPSHASILTSTYPAVHGLYNNSDVLAEGFTTLPEIFRKHSYRTGAFLGAWVIGREYGFDQGFDDFSVSDDDNRPDEVAGWLADNRAGRFFLWIHLFGPHRPYQPPKPYDTMYDSGYTGGMDGSVEEAKKIYDEKIKLSDRDLKHLVALYDGEVSYVDELLSKIYVSLEENGLTGNTVIVFTADHGEMLYEKEFYFGHAFDIYQPTVRVPLIIDAPGVTTGGTRVPSTVELMDIAPTILDLAGIKDEVTKSYQGVSLMPLLNGGAWDDRPAYSATYAPEGREDKASVVVGGWKLIRYLDGSRTMLFDIAHDPLELADLSKKDTAKADELGKLYAKHPGVGKAKRGKMDEETARKLRSLGYAH